MPDSISPKVPWARKHSSTRPFEGEPEPTTARRKWRCPGEHTIAAYVDGALLNRRRERIETHLSGCIRCRLLVADALKAQRDSDVAPTPTQLIQKARGLALRRRSPWLWIWAPAGAVAGFALLIVAGSTMVARKPEPTIARLVLVPAAPQVGTPVPPQAQHESVPDVVRNGQIRTLVPILLSPLPGDVMSSDRLRFCWKPVQHSKHYEVRILKTDGDLVWEGETAKSALQVPSDIVLQEGAYFVWITASLDNGQKIKSLPVRFRLRQAH